MASCSSTATNGQTTPPPTVGVVGNEEMSVEETSPRPTYGRSTPLPGSIVEEADPPTPEEEAAFWDCLDAFGYSRSDYDALLPEGFFSKDDPELSQFMDTVETCAHDSGVGYSANLDPAYIAAANESHWIEARCMQDLGWSDFPDPVPGENGRLRTGAHEWPSGAEELEAYLADREYCGTQSGMPFFRE